MAPKRQKQPVSAGFNRNNHSHQYLTTTSDCHPVHAFWGAMQAIYGREIPLPLPDGEIHRFHAPGATSGTCNGWYEYHMGGIAWGRIGSWKIASPWMVMRSIPCRPVLPATLTRLTTRSPNSTGGTGHARA
jgi:hypothetical protein